MPKQSSSVETLEQPAKFFNDTKGFLALLRGIPVVAIEQLKKDDCSRDTLIAIIRACYHICDDAGIDIVEEIEKQDLRDSAQYNLKEMMRDDCPVTLEQLKSNGLKLAFGKDGPYVVPA